MLAASQKRECQTSNPRGCSVLTRDDFQLYKRGKNSPHVPKVFSSIIKVSRPLRTHSGFCLIVFIGLCMTCQDWAVGGGPEESWWAPSDTS